MCYAILVVFLLFHLPTHAQQRIDKTLVHDGLIREYRLYIPAAYTGQQPVPLIFNLHGYTSNNYQQEWYSSFQTIADTAHFIICLPNGTFDSFNNRFWNIGFSNNVDDIGFLMTLLDTLMANYHIDPARVYCTGMSNGGFMSYALACARADRIAAIASVTGGMTYAMSQQCQPTRPIPVLQIHGTADATVPYTGNAQFMPIDSVIAFWVTHNNCPYSPTVSPLPDVNTTDGCTAIRYTYDQCQEKSEVVLFKIDGGGHTWPGSPITIGTTNRDFSASEAIWHFFQKHPHPSYVSSTPATPSIQQSINIFPNPSGNMLSIESEHAENYLHIADTNGKSCYSIVFFNKTTLDLSALPQGIYTITITNSKQQIQKKFIKI